LYIDLVEVDWKREVIGTSSKGIFDVGLKYLQSIPPAVNPHHPKAVAYDHFLLIHRLCAVLIPSGSVLITTILSPV
jgi:hypothetical protein